MLIIDTLSGTILSVEDCVLIDTNSLTDDQIEELMSLSDSEIADYGRNHGHAII